MFSFVCVKANFFFFFSRKKCPDSFHRELAFGVDAQPTRVPRASVHAGDDQGSQARAAPTGDTIQAAAGGQAGGPALHGGAY